MLSGIAVVVLYLSTLHSVVVGDSALPLLFFFVYRDDK